MDTFYWRYLVYFLPFAAAVAATLHLDKYKNSEEYYFVYFLWFAFLVDITGAILSTILYTPIFWIYNLYMVVSFLFYFYWYRRILRRKSFKIAIVAFCAAFIAIAVWNHIFQSWNEYHQYTFVAGASFTLICTLFHFWELLNGNEVLNVKHKLAFWISTGLLLFNMGMIPLMLLSKYLDLSADRHWDSSH